MLKAFSRLLVVSCFVAAVLSQDGLGGSGEARASGGDGSTLSTDTCLFWGDPHIWTFDSAVYSYQDPGWHHILVSPNLNIQSNFIPGCYGPIPTNACAQDLRIFVLDDDNVQHSVEVYLSPTAAPGYVQVFAGSVYYQILIDGNDSGLYSVWDGQQVTFPGVQPNVQVSIGSNAVGYFYLVNDNSIFQLKFVVNGDVIIAHIPEVLSITPAESNPQQNSLWNNICGLCGNFNGYSGDDFNLHSTYDWTIKLSNDNIPVFGNSWALDYQAAGTAAPTLSPANATSVYTCHYTPNPTPTPKPTPSATPAPPTRAPPTTTPPTPSPTPSNAPPTNSPPAPSPTPSQTPAPTNPPSVSPTPGPTYPPTAPPTQPPTNPPTSPPGPTPPAPSPTPVPHYHNNTNYTSVDNTTAISNAQGSPIYQAALQSCQNAGLAPNTPLWDSCMYDVTQTNTTTSAVASAGALVLAGCAKTNLSDSACVAGTLFACPGACNANGACVNGQCQCNKGYQGPTCTKAPLLTAAQLAGVISAGAVAGIAIGAAVFAGLAGFGAKKGYDYYQMSNNKMANVNSNPLYAEKNTGGVSPLYAEKA